MAQQESITLEPGMVVVDRDRDEAEQNEAVVMSLPPVPAEQWDVTQLDCTLAEDNPDYPADAQTVIVIYRSRFDGDDEQYRIDIPNEIRQKLRERDEIAIGDISSLCKFYSFPAPRLEPTGEHWPPEEDDSNELAQPEPEAESNAETLSGDALEEEDEGEQAVDLTRLAAVMREAGFGDVEQHGDHVAATRLGETYRVDHTGEVVAGGAMADKLASFVRKRYVETGDNY